MSKHLIEIEIPDGKYCAINGEYKCPFLDDGADYEYAPCCQNPDLEKPDWGELKGIWEPKKTWRETARRSEPCKAIYGYKEDAQ
jgi:hypothetical protein